MTMTTTVATPVTINYQNYTRAVKPLVTAAGYDKREDHFVITTADGAEHEMDRDDIADAFDVLVCDPTEMSDDDEALTYATFCETKGYDVITSDEDDCKTPCPTEQWDVWSDCPKAGHPHHEEYRPWYDGEVEYIVESRIDWALEQLDDEVVGEKRYGDGALYIDLSTGDIHTTATQEQLDDDWVTMELYLCERTTEVNGNIEAALRLGRRRRYLVVTSRNVFEESAVLSMWHIAGDEAELHDERKYIFATKARGLVMAYGAHPADNLDDAIADFYAAAEAAHDE